jgi:TPR repeat protein
MRGMRFELPGFAEDRARPRGRIPELTAAASSGNVEAQLALAWEYACGDAVDADIRTAWDWFDRAAACGQEEAIVHRARFLQLRGVAEGARELRRFAVAGNWKAQFWLARYHGAQAGRVSQLRAVVWYDRSYRNGNRAAKLAKLGQLTRIADQPSKAVFAVRSIVEAVSFVWQFSQNADELDPYQTLVHRLKRKAR